MAIYLPPVHERTYISSQLDAHAKRWYGKGAAAGSSGKFSNGYEAWDKAKLSIKTPLSHGRAVEAHEYFLGGFNDGERGRELRKGRRNPGGSPAKLSAQLARLTAKATRGGMTAGDVAKAQQLIAQLKAAGSFPEGRRNPAGPWRSIAAIRAANKAAGQHWFDRDSMQFFGSRLAGSTVYGGRYFVASRMPPHGSREYLVYSASPEARISTAAGPFGSLKDAVSEARGLGSADKHNPAGAGDWIKAKAVRVVRDSSGRARQLLIQT